MIVYGVLTTANAMSLLHRAAPALLVMLVIASSGCIPGYNDDVITLEIAGFVRNAEDSSAVPDAELTIFLVEPVIAEYFSTSTESDGSYHDSRTFLNNSYPGTPEERVWLLRVYDVDGPLHGVFSPYDTLLHEVPESKWYTIRFQVDFYIEMEPYYQLY